MPLENLPDHGPMLLPGADGYHLRMLDAARGALALTRHAFDIEYGPHPLQRLDIWMPLEPAKAPLPVVVFFHGGAFRNGYKEWIGAMVPAVTASPAILVSPDYRLVPQVDVPTILEDCRQALAWVHAHAAEYGGNPERVLLGGHSAGGYLAAMLAMAREPGRTHGGVCGCIAISSLFSLARNDLPKTSMFHLRNEDFLPPEADQSLFSVPALMRAGAPPFALISGAHDLPEVEMQNRQLARAMADYGLEVSHEVIAQADHFQAHLACNDASGPFCAWLGRLLRQ